MPSPLARTHIALDPGYAVRPLATPDRDQPDAVRDWLAHLAAGRLIPAPRAPATPDSQTDTYPENVPVPTSTTPLV